MPATPVTGDLLRRFSPLDSLRRENIAALAKKIEVRTLEPGRLLVREGDVDKRTYYLVTGTLELINHQGAVQLLRAASDEAAERWRTLGNRPMLADSLATAALYASFRGEGTLALAAAREAMDIARSSLDSGRPAGSRVSG